MIIEVRKSTWDGVSGVDNKNFNVARALNGSIALENLIDGV